MVDPEPASVTSPEPKNDAKAVADDVRDQTDLFRQDHHYAGLFWSAVDIAGAQRDQEEEFRKNWLARFWREISFLILALPAALAPMLLSSWKHGMAMFEGLYGPGMFVASVSSMLLLGSIFLLYRKTVQVEYQRRLLERMVTTDPLTRLGNRRAMWETLERELTRAKTNAQKLTLVLIDLDRFKRVNDIHGHVVGDSVLKAFASAVRATTRPALDFAFRIGGDEFVVLVSADVPEARCIAEQLRTTFLEAANPLTRGVVLDCSIGFTGYNEGESLEDWVHRADLAIYKAKASGGGTLTEALAP